METKNISSLTQQANEYTTKLNDTLNELRNELRKIMHLHWFEFYYSEMYGYCITFDSDRMKSYIVPVSEIINKHNELNKCLSVENIKPLHISINNL